MEFGERLVPNVYPYGVSQEHIARYIFAENYVEGKTVLDVACGCGYGTDYLAQSAKQVFGVDVSQEAIDYANENYKKDNMIFLQGNACSLPFPDHSFDVIISFETLEHIPDYEQFISECYRVLNNDGIFICSTPNKNASAVENQYHVKEFTPDEFKQLTSTKFKIIKMFGQSRIKKIDTLALKTRTLIGSILEKIPVFNYLLEHHRQNRQALQEAMIFDEDLLSILNKEYAVSHLEDSFLSSSAYMIAVCKK